MPERKSGRDLLQRLRKNRIGQECRSAVEAWVKRAEFTGTAPSNGEILLLILANSTLHAALAKGLQPRLSRAHVPPRLLGDMLRALHFAAAKRIQDSGEFDAAPYRAFLAVIPEGMKEAGKQEIIGLIGRDLIAAGEILGQFSRDEHVGTYETMPDALAAAVFTTAQLALLADSESSEKLLKTIEFELDAGLVLRALLLASQACIKMHHGMLVRLQTRVKAIKPGDDPLVKAWRATVLRLIRDAMNT